MSMEDRIWALVTKRQANEATPGELAELMQLLKRHPDIDEAQIYLRDWWQAESQQYTSCNGAALFEKIKQKIKTGKVPPDS